MFRNVSMPSFVEKKAPHFGHLIIEPLEGVALSLDSPAHPRERQNKIAGKKSTHVFFISADPFLFLFFTHITPPPMRGRKGWGVFHKNGNAKRVELGYCAIVLMETVYVRTNAFPSKSVVVASSDSSYWVFGIK